MDFYNYFLFCCAFLNSEWHIFIVLPIVYYCSRAFNRFDTINPKKKSKTKNCKEQKILFAENVMKSHQCLGCYQSREYHFTVLRWEMFLLRTKTTYFPVLDEKYLYSCL